MPQFSDENIERLFGAEDAENENIERFKEYFYTSSTYENVNSALPFRILVGHKGVGKSALLRRAFIYSQDNELAAIWLQPGDYSILPKAEHGISFIDLVESIKKKLYQIIEDKIFKEFREGSGIIDEISGSALEYVDGISERLSKLLTNYGSKVKGKIAESFLKSKKIIIFIDDIDRGWTSSKNDIMQISALMTAIRDICGVDSNIRFRIGLRSDVYFLVRTSDESTDKLERHVLWLQWTLHDILCIIAKRVDTFFGGTLPQGDIQKLNQDQISTQILAKVIEPRFQGKGHWSNRSIHNVLLALTRKRPRDLVKLLYGAARVAWKEKSEIIYSRHLEASFEQYSNERLQDIINEFRSEMPDIERLLLAMRPTKIERRTAQNFTFSRSELSAKITNIRGSVPIYFTNSRIVTNSSIIQFLYKIEFITARKVIAERIERRHFDQSRFLASEFADFGFDWEIHPAYRWALQPQGLKEILDTLYSD